jgi:glycopeptide antibiotics resistance protein
MLTNTLTPSIHSLLTTHAWRTLCLLWAGAIVVGTTIPWNDFQNHSHWGLVQWMPYGGIPRSKRALADLVINVLLYLPFGYCTLRAFPGRTGRRMAAILLLAAALSLSTETSQVFHHNRMPSMTDVCNNILGTYLGAFAARRHLTRASTR